MKRKEESLDVKIDGLLYRLKADENPWYMRTIAQQAGQMIAEIKRDQPRASAQARSVLALINALDHLHKSLDINSQLEVELKSQRDLIASLRADIVRLRSDLDEGKEAVRFYHNLADSLQASLVRQEGEDRRKRQEIGLLDKKQVDLMKAEDWHTVVDKTEK